MAPGPVWTVAENYPLPGFDPRTVQPVASRYTVYGIPAPQKERTKFNFIFRDKDCSVMLHIEYFCCIRFRRYEPSNKCNAVLFGISLHSLGLLLIILLLICVGFCVRLHTYFLRNVVRLFEVKFSELYNSYICIFCQPTSVRSVTRQNLALEIECLTRLRG